MSLEPSFLVVDKPPGITSHDVVAMVRAITGIKKVGHTGTLDPFATGVLPLALGGATRLIQYLDESIKVYDATIRLGSATDTGDPTGTVVEDRPLPEADEVEVRDVLGSFLGQRMQVPPAYSAVKHKGKPLYHYARKGVDVQVQPRPVTIHDLELLSYDRMTLRVMITCSRGTYARVLAHEIATALGSAGHLEALSRPRSGPFLLEDSVDMAALGAMAAAEPGHTWQEVLLTRKKREERVKWKPRDEVRHLLEAHVRRPLEALSHLPLCDVNPTTAEKVRRGGASPPAPSGLVAGGRFLIVSGPDVVAVAEATSQGPKVLRVVG